LEVELYGPLNFSDNIGYPNKLPPPRWVRHIWKFHGHTRLAAQHVTLFIDFISNIKEVLENVVMKMFGHTLEEDLNRWFKHVGRGEISSFAGLNHFASIGNSYEEEKRVEDLVDEPHDACVMIDAFS
jgi:hypothetical protein